METFCCCFSAKTGIVIIGFVCLLKDVLLGCYSCGKLLDIYNDYDLRPLFVFVLAFSLLNIFSIWALLSTIFIKNKITLVPWLMLNYLQVPIWILYTLVMIFVVSLSTIKNDYIGLIVSVPGGFLVSGTEVYFLIYVTALYRNYESYFPRDVGGVCYNNLEE